MMKFIGKSKTFMSLIPIIFVLLGIFLLYVNTKTASNDAAKSRESAKPIRAYTIATNCFLAVPAANRTPEYIDYCYNEADRIVGTHVQRFGNN